MRSRACCSRMTAYNWVVVSIVMQVACMGRGRWSRQEREPLQRTCNAPKGAGPASVLGVAEVPEPHAGPGRIRVAVRVSGVTPADGYVRAARNIEIASFGG